MPIWPCQLTANDYKAYANVKWYQRLFLPGYAKKHGHPQWHLNKEKCECFIKIAKTAALFSFWACFQFSEVCEDDKNKSLEVIVTKKMVLRSNCIL